MFLIVILGSKLGNTMQIFWELGGNIFNTPKSGTKKRVEKYMLKYLSFRISQN
jgi:hypothetical protein